MRLSFDSPRKKRFDGVFQRGDDSMTDEEMTTAMTSLVGRMAMLEVLNANMLAHMCLQFKDPVRLAGFIMAETAENLQRARDRAPVEERPTADYALASFDNLHRAMLALVTNLATASGNG
jgi:hypothetical protein